MVKVFWYGTLKLVPSTRMIPPRTMVRCAIPTFPTGSVAVTVKGLGTGTSATPGNEHAPVLSDVVWSPVVWSTTGVFGAVLPTRVTTAKSVWSSPSGGVSNAGSRPKTTGGGVVSRVKERSWKGET